MSEKKTPIELGFRPYDSMSNSWYHPELHISISVHLDREIGEVWFEAHWNGAGKTHSAPGKHATWHEAYEAVAKDAQRYWTKRRKEEQVNEREEDEIGMD